MQFEKISILIVDDSHDVHNQLKVFLRTVSVEDLYFADSAATAYDILGITDGAGGQPNRSIDLILMDINMKDLNGIEATRKIKMVPEFQDVPVLMITGDTSQKSLQDAFEAGAVDYITKPLNKAEFLARVSSFLKLKTEIDARKKIEKVLRESEEKYKLLAENSADVIYKINLENEEFTYVSPSVKGLLGYTSEEALSLKPQDIQTAESYAKQREKLIKALESGRRKPEFMEIEAYHKDGHTLPVEINAAFVFDGQGNPAEILGTVRNISERKRAEEKLQKSEERYKFLAENMADIVWTVDMDFKATYVSPSIEKVLGYTPEERTQQKMEEQVTPDTFKRVTALLLEELKREEEPDSDPDRTITMDVEYYHRNGPNVWMQNIVKAIRNQKGDMIGMYGSSRDITERKNAQEALMREKEKLEEALLQIEKNNVIINQKSDEQKELLQILCHDLANPFTSLSALLDLSIDDPSIFREFGEIMQVSVKNGLDTIDLVREMRDLEDKSDKLNIERTNLVQMVKDSKIILGQRFKEKKIDLVMEIEDDHDVFVERRSFVNSVLNNILSNAIKYSFPGAKILVKSIQKNNTLALSIKDQGIGIPPKLINSLFDFSKSTSREGTKGERGTGFGMPLIKKFIETYQGTLEIKSTVKTENSIDHGTEVILNLRT